MADFCRQCNSELFGRDKADFCPTPEWLWKEGMARQVLCEGCGIIQIDTEGRCISNCMHAHGDGNKAFERN